MTMKPCSLFDRYRDRELDDAARIHFERHLEECEDCSLRMSLLNNIVRIIRTEEVRPRDMSAEIAHRVFQQGKSWDVLIVSLLRPGPAIAALAMFIAVFSTLWMISDNWQRNTIRYEYERLIEEADSINLNRVAEVTSDAELVIWLEGVSQ